MSDLIRGALSTPEFWRSLDGRIRQAVGRRAAPVRGVLQAVVTSGRATIATFVGRAGEPPVPVESAELFGFTSSPPANVEVVAVPVGGSSAHLVIVGQVDRTYRPVDLEPGETRIYCALAGTQIRIRAGGTVEMVGPTGIILNNGVLGVARLTDTINIDGGFAVWLAAVVASVSTGTPVAVPVPTTIGAIASASTTVKAG